MSWDLHVDWPQTAGMALVPACSRIACAFLSLPTKTNLQTELPLLLPVLVKAVEWTGFWLAAGDINHWLLVLVGGGIRKVISKGLTIGCGMD